MLKTKKELIDLKNNFNELQAGASEIVKKQFINYKPEIKTAEEVKLRSPIWSEARSSLQGIKGNVPAERARINAEIDKVKYPNATSEDLGKKMLAESYKQSATLFLAGTHQAKEIIAEIERALKFKEYECAFTLIERTLARLPEDGVYSPAQKYLAESLSEIYNNSEIKKKIEPFENQFNEVAETEQLIEVFEKQLDNNVKQAVLLHSEMNEQEVNEAKQLANSGTLPAAQSVAIKNRMHKYSQA